MHNWTGIRASVVNEQQFVGVVVHFEVFEHYTMGLVELGHEDVGRLGHDVLHIGESPLFGVVVGQLDHALVARLQNGNGAQVGRLFDFFFKF